MFHLIWRLFWVLLAGVNFGERAVYIALAGHIGVPLLGLILRAIHPLFAVLGVRSMSFYLMHYTVVTLGWSCFWVLFISFVWANVNIERYPSGHIKSLSGTVGR